MDVFSPAQRSEIMRRVRSKNTRPEMTVRKLIYGMGYRYRTHCRAVRGCPDIVLSGRKQAIFVHGCFWHRHTCSSATLPKGNRDYWESKQNRNAARDKQNVRALRKSGWKVLTIWECELKNVNRLQRRLRRFLEV